MIGYIILIIKIRVQQLKLHIAIDIGNGRFYVCKIINGILYLDDRKIPERFTKEEISKCSGIFIYKNEEYMINSFVDSSFSDREFIFTT